MIIGRFKLFHSCTHSTPSEVGETVTGPICTQPVPPGDVADTSEFTPMEEFALTVRDGYGAMFAACITKTVTVRAPDATVQRKRQNPG